MRLVLAYLTVLRSGLSFQSRSPWLWRRSLSVGRAAAGGPTSSVEVLQEWDDGYLVWKPFGVAMYGSKPTRAGPTLQQWLLRSQLERGDAVLAAVGTKEAGIIVVGKPHVDAATMQRLSSRASLSFTALVQGTPDAQVANDGLTTIMVVESAVSKTFGTMSKIHVETDGRQTTASVSETLGALGCPVIGSAAARGPGVTGPQLALTSLLMPSGLLSPGAAECHGLRDTPRKFDKLLRREALFYEREEAAQRELGASEAAEGGRGNETVRFRGLEFMVGAGLLRPRESSACLVDAALTHLKARSDLPPRILDLGTGTGALIIAASLDSGMASEGRNVGVDIDEGAISCAKQNAANLMPERREGSGPALDFFTADFTRLHTDRHLFGPEPFGIIICNPPFFSARTIAKRISDEADTALSSGESGFEFYDAICANVAACSPPLLSPGGGRLIFQLPFGPRARKAVEKVAAKHGAAVANYVSDDRGVDRAVVLHWDDAVDKGRR